MTLKVIGPAAIPTLVDSIRRNEEWGKDSWSIIRMACEALGEIGPAAVPALIDLIKRSDEFSDKWIVICEAHEALKKIGPAALSGLKSFIGPPSPLDELTKNGIRQNIEQIDKKHGKGQAGPYRINVSNCFQLICQQAMQVYCLALLGNRPPCAPSPKARWVIYALAEGEKDAKYDLKSGALMNFK
jgi:hypothetical protein